MVEAAIALIALVLILLVSLFRNSISEFNSSQTMSRLENNPAFAHEIADRLMFKYANKYSPDCDGFKDWAENGKAQLRFAKFEILNIAPAGEERYLLVTIILDKQYRYSLQGAAHTVTRLYDVNFSICYNAHDKQYEVYAGMYKDLREKNLYTEFSMMILEQVMGEIKAYPFQ